MWVAFFAGDRDEGSDEKSNIKIHKQTKFSIAKKKPHHPNSYTYQSSLVFFFFCRGDKSTITHAFEPFHHPTTGENPPGAIRAQR